MGVWASNAHCLGYYSWRQLSGRFLRDALCPQTPQEFTINQPVSLEPVERYGEDESRQELIQFPHTDRGHVQQFWSESSTKTEDKNRGPEGESSSAQCVCRQVHKA